MTATDLHQIIYTSHSVAQMSSDQLVELLTQSRRDNAASGITGLLLHADGSFMQTIEGKFESVQALFARISGDPRHDGIILICDEPVARRSYGDWSMAFREISHDDAVEVPGFHREQKFRDALDRDVARNLMRTFFNNADIRSR